MTAMARLRRLWLDVHLWIGVGLLVILIPLSVTGAILVWHDALDRRIYAERYAVSGPTASQPLPAYADSSRCSGLTLRPSAVTNSGSIPMKLKTPVR